MHQVSTAVRWLAQEVVALESRLILVPRFAATIPMVHESAPSDRAVHLADDIVERSKRVLHRQVRHLTRNMSQQVPTQHAFRRWQLRYHALRNRFDELQTTVDIFADALTQRAEHKIGPLLRGLDVLARDGLQTRASLFPAPPLVSYLDRGLGGSVRRVFTNLPGAGRNSIALVRIPRERLCGNGYASLLHEVGHQGAALLDLVGAYRRWLAEEAASGALEPAAVAYWSAKISEVTADVWACAKLGITGTLGLFGVLGRAARFTFQESPQGPHPMPWLRGRMSVAFGAAAMPHSLWAELLRIWTTLYPLESAPPGSRALLDQVLPSIDRVAQGLALRRLPELRGQSLREALNTRAVAPGTLLPQLEAMIDGVRSSQPTIRPCVALAAVGLARYRGLLTPIEENALIAAATRQWAREGIAS